MKTILVTILILLASASYAAQKAITDTGEEVILNSDGTWKYFDNSAKAASTIELNSDRFKKAKSSTFLLKSTKTNTAYWVNADKWNFKKATMNNEAEYEFHLRGEDLYGMVISEGVEMPVEGLTDIALTNAQSVSPDAQIINREYRYVNGVKVIHMQINGTFQGVKFTYLGYYYSDASGSAQFLAYTGASAVDKYRTEIFDFLNGFVTQ